MKPGLHDSYRRASIIHMIRTYGLTHAALAVRDVDRSMRFYQSVFGAVRVYGDDRFLQMQTPGTRDVLVFEKNAKLAGKTGGVMHLGFRLIDPGDIQKAAKEVERAGGTIREQGEFVPGEPYLYAIDPDGYEIEIWFEIPTPVDPSIPRPRKPKRHAISRKPG
jgi:catechol 2,3-dioxygenase-like lactoylglutathione lyase family enzyme